MFHDLPGYFNKKKLGGKDMQIKVKSGTFDMKYSVFGGTGNAGYGELIEKMKVLDKHVRKKPWVNGAYHHKQGRIMFGGTIKNIKYYVEIINHELMHHWIMTNMEDPKSIDHWQHEWIVGEINGQMTELRELLLYADRF